MKAIMIKPKNQSEYKFISGLLKKLGIGSSSLQLQELEDLGLSRAMRGLNKQKKASRSEIMKKLST